MTSAPIRSIASSNQIALPQLLCIGRPASSSSFSYPGSPPVGGAVDEHDAHEELP